MNVSPTATPPAPMTLLATSRDRSYDERQTLVLKPEPVTEAASFPTLDEAIAAAADATRGAATGAAAILAGGDGFVAREIVVADELSPWSIERSRAKGPRFAGEMHVLDPSVRAIVDGRRQERTPDYSVPSPDAWGDLPLMRITRSAVGGGDSETITAFAQHRKRYPAGGESMFTQVATTLDAALEKTAKFASSHGGAMGLAVLQAADGSFHATAFDGSNGLFDGGRERYGKDKGTYRPPLFEIDAITGATQGLVALVGATDHLLVEDVAGAARA